MKEIGSQLREAREKKKLSIHDVAIATKINNKIIKAIEDGNPDTLPAKPFLRGFVQTYARYLELNVDDVMKRFLDAHGSTKPKPQIVEEGGVSAQVSHEEVQNKVEMYKKIAYVVAAIVAIVFIYFIQKIVSKYEQESKIAKEQKEVVKAQIPAEETPATPAVQTVEGPATDPNATPAATPATDVKPVEVKADEKKVEEKKVEEKKPEEKKPEPVKTEEKKPEVKTEVKPPVSAVPLVTAPPTPIAKPATPAVVPPPVVKPAEVKPVVAAVVPPVKPAETKPVEVKKEEEKKPVATGKPQQLIIEALDNVEIRYSKDGESERTVKLKPEQFLTIKAGTKINLNVSDSGAINIIHNGRDKGVPGNLGQPTKISYP